MNITSTNIIKLSILVLCLTTTSYAAYELALWSGGDAPANHTATAFLPNSIEVRIHDVDSDTWRYNMGPAIIGHNGTMHCIWKSTPGDETSNNAVTRYSFSTNNGLTWSIPAIIAQDASGASKYGHGTLFIQNNCVYAFIPREVGMQYAETELFQLNGVAWSRIGLICQNFYPQENPKLMPNGNWICGGFEMQSGTTYSAVIISQASNISNSWTLRRVEAYLHRGFETSTWIDGTEVTACTRQWKKGLDGVLRMGSLVSTDSGNSWNPGYIINYPASNFPFVDAHIYADHMSNGKRYIVYNMPVNGVYNNRKVLAIAFAESGSRVLSSIYKIRDHGDTEPHYTGIAKDPGWMQANGCEYNGNIYIAYVRAKEDVELTIFPLQSAEDIVPPLPNPISFSILPHAAGMNSISMTAETAIDGSGVEYYFECTAGGGHDSSWQDSSVYEDSGLIPDTQYTYRVKARDKSAAQNETAFSSPASATTDSNNIFPDPAQWLVPPHISSMGTTTIDSANGHDGTLENGAVINETTGEIDGSAQLDGINDHINIPDYNGILAKGARTCSAWVKTSQAGTILSWGDPITGNNWRFTIQDSFGLVGQKGGPCIKVGAAGYSAGIADVRDNNWHHVAAVLPSVLTPYTTHINYYVDGIKKTLIASPAAINTASGHNVKIGTYNNADYFNGLIDDIRIYNRSLSDAEIVTLAAKGAVSSTGLVAHWMLDNSINGITIVSMNAVGGTPYTSEIEYYFESLAENGPDSGWQISPYFEIRDVLPCDKFTYRVRMRFLPGNYTTQWSIPKSDYVPCDSDFDKDDDVDEMDLMYFTDSWLSSDLIPQNLDQQGNIDFLDFALFSEVWLWNTDDLFLD
ncbi:MAG: hypothetical protein A2Y10_13400 [Planctomycetes bacterium GWF2_41_51]|nr:MAG: hypothetical protein A2Y10_13400 [Planctomycetes bacterium GWF2_41_51]HBG26270.1 hypothetical protein [Phycisphaerales bacterium]